MVSSAIADPESLVKRFIEDYRAWNDRSHLRCEQDDSPQALETAEADYADLLKRYCRPGFTGEPIAFGSTSSHHPDTERVLSVTSDGPRCVVMTLNRDATGFQARYEYSLICENERWYLEALDYIDADGDRLPSL